jgi:glycosyltransferase involved in cell wall biosynthesis
LKILIVIPAYYPALDFGGPVPVARELARRFAERGHEMTVWTTNLYSKGKKLGNKTEERSVDGIRVVYFNSLIRYRWVGITPDVYRYLRREGERFDVIHVYGYREFLTLAVTRWAARNGKPYVLQSMGTVGRMSRSMSKKLLYDTVLGRGILKNAAKLIAKTPLEKNQYLTAGVEPERISVIPNGMDIPEEIDELEGGEFRSAYGLSKEDPLVLFLGRLHPVKGVDLLVRAFRRLEGRAQLAIVGPDEGPREELERMVESVGIRDRVVFTGPLYDEQKWAAYLDADVYVLPSAFENFPRSVLEAMSCRTPVIITDRCGIAAEIRDVAGLVVPYEEGALLKAMERLVDNPELRERMSEQGLRLLDERFSWPPIVEELENLYEQAEFSQVKIDAFSGTN